MKIFLFDFVSIQAYSFLFMALHTPISLFDQIISRTENDTT